MLHPSVSPSSLAACCSRPHRPSRSRPASHRGMFCLYASCCRCCPAHSTTQSSKAKKRRDTRITEAGHQAPGNFWISILYSFIQISRAAHETTSLRSSKAPQSYLRFKPRIQFSMIGPTPATCFTFTTFTCPDHPHSHSSVVAVLMDVGAEGNGPSHNNSPQ